MVLDEKEKTIGDHAAGSDSMRAGGLARQSRHSDIQA